MKNLILFLFLMVILTLSTYGQVTNLIVNNSATGFTMASGDQMSWSYNVPNSGDTTLVQIWIDTDQNGLLNPAVDVIWTFFNQIDGDDRGQNGPPDGDNRPYFVGMQQNLGLAPAHYIMVFRNHNNYKYMAGTITELVSPTYTITGSVSVPANFNKQNIVISLDSDHGKMFWDGITDANGNFTIKMNSDTAGNPWRVRTNNDIIFGAGIVSPQEYSFVITPGTTTYANNNFSIAQAAAKIVGTLKDEFGNPRINWGVQANSSTQNFSRYVQTDTAGVFKIGLLPTELPASNIFVGSGSSDQNDTTVMTGLFGASQINSGDVFNHDIIIYKSNSTISGRLTLNGIAPGFNQQMICGNMDTAFVLAYTDTYGNFTFHVTNKILNYNIAPYGTVQGFINSSVAAHPGETNVNLNLSITGIKGIDPKLPSEFNLSQNYPNPFNPSTTINYSIAKEGHVKLTIYNMLGGKVATLVNENKTVGSYSIQFNASKLASGIYLYKLESGNFTAEKKLILMK